MHTDLSAVRIHRDAQADAATRAVGARAYAFGAHVAFGAGQFAPEHADGLRLLAHEMAHVAANAAASGAGSHELLSRVPLADFSQKGETCDPASLLSALILWDRDNAVAGAPNANLVGVCNAALLYMAKNQANLIVLYGRKGNGVALFDEGVRYLSATRERLRTTGAAATEVEYQKLSTIFEPFGHDASEVLQRLGLAAPKDKPGNTLADIFADPDLRGLKPGEAAQLNWITTVRQQYSDGRDAGTAQGLHAFLVGRGKDGTWFLSDQGVVPALHLEATSPEALLLRLNEAGAAGKTIVITNPAQGKTTWGWTGVRILPAQNYAKPFQNLAPPGTFLAEVDAGWSTTGERVVAWDFVGTGYDDKDIAALFTASGSGHGFLIGEAPAGVFSVYKTNPVGVKNVAVSEIDKADSINGLLSGNGPFVHAWLKLRSSADTSTTGRGFRVY